MDNTKENDYKVIVVFFIADKCFDVLEPEGYRISGWRV